jgi:hypothetical protein
MEPREQQPASLLAETTGSNKRRRVSVGVGGMKEKS